MKFRKDAIKFKKPRRLVAIERAREKTRTSKISSVHQLGNAGTSREGYDDWDQDSPEWEYPDDDIGYESAQEECYEPRSTRASEVGDDVEEERGTSADIVAAMKGVEDLEVDTHKDLVESVEGDEYEEWLKAVSTNTQGQQVYFEFADTGKCKWEDKIGKACRFSHKREDIERYKAAKLLGPKAMSDGAKAWAATHHRSNPTGGTAGLHGKSPGVRASFQRDGKARPGVLQAPSGGVMRRI